MACVLAGRKLMVLISVWWRENLGVTQKHRTGLLHYIHYLLCLSCNFWPGEATVSTIFFSHGTFKKNWSVFTGRAIPQQNDSWKYVIFLHFKLKWNIAMQISENNECINLIKHPRLGSKTKRPGFLFFRSYISVLFPTNLYETTCARFSYERFYFPPFFQLHCVGMVLSWHFCD